ncbi:GntR family transcriptional regulator [Nitratireductor pacificus]|uniref:GntR family transcriptional regulator n=1 Tax=Nitratireductor pacificus pht-3B TaxID=391937 RepID=K2LJB1_9HYPH|nr:GntR family transcriptional regulator [Nitratireductor pacificus]EKF17829.1 GntR family transcriptional regulator [Nitratireductor pacificus pht-3B]
MLHTAIDEEEPRTKTEAAYLKLRKDILATRLMPGAPLRIGALRETYGLGWTPLREALSRLEAERLVTAVSNRGFAVAPVSRGELEDLSKARLAVETTLLEEAIRTGGGAWEEAVVTAHYRLSRCTNPGRTLSEAALLDWVQKHQEFHEALLSAADSEWLKHFYAQIWGQLCRHHIFLTVRPTLRAAAGHETGHEAALAALHDAMSLDQHTRLMELSLDRDLEGAMALMKQHVGLTVDVYTLADAPGMEDGGEDGGAAA